MHKKALILDLDNTLYSVQSIREPLFAPLFELIRQDGSHERNMENIKKELMQRPFQAVAKDYQFSEKLTSKGVSYLSQLTYKGPIEPFEDYRHLHGLPVEKFLVTTGFPKLQQSKIEGMKIAKDFKEIHIVDPSTSEQTKKDVFADIMERHGYTPSEVLVVGDDLLSEIKAAQDLGIDAVLYNKQHVQAATSFPITISSFEQLRDFLI